MKIKTTLFFFLFLGITQLFAQSSVINIYETDSSVKTIDFTTLKNITFQNYNLKLNYWSGNEETIATTSISKIMFGNTTGLNDLKNVQNLSVYPNPAINSIIINSESTQKSDVSIYSVAGQQVLNVKNYLSGQTIDVSQLSKGFYLIKLNNQTVKMIKE